MAAHSLVAGTRELGSHPSPPRCSAALGSGLGKSGLADEVDFKSFPPLEVAFEVPVLTNKKHSFAFQLLATLYTEGRRLTEEVAVVKEEGKLQEHTHARKNLSKSNQKACRISHCMSRGELVLLSTKRWYICFDLSV